MDVVHTAADSAAMSGFSFPGQMPPAFGALDSGGGGGAAPTAMPKMLCCQCGVAIDHNPTSMCAQCLALRVDVTEGIATQLIVHRCRGCERWLKPGWMVADLESAELMTICLKKVKGLGKVKLVDASWIWTEEHAMRLKVKLTVQKEVMGGAVLQQSFVVEYMVRNKQCEDCAKQYTNGTWCAVVQVRQRVDHKRTFFYLEQLLLKHSAHTKALSIQSFRDGMDFFFTRRNEAIRFQNFLTSVVPVKSKVTKKLVSADNHSNTFNIKFTYFMDMCTLCKDDLAVLPASLAKQLGDLCPLVLVERVTSLVHVVDPVTCERATFDIEAHDKHGAHNPSAFQRILAAPQLIEYVVLGVEAAVARERAGAAASGGLGGKQLAVGGGKGRIATVEVARSSDLGSNDNRFVCSTHLGHLLNAGDTVLGYDVNSAAAQLDEDTLKVAEKRSALPDVVLVRKLYGADSKKRGWALRQLQVDVYQEEDQSGQIKGGTGGTRAHMAADGSADYERFMQQLESDKEMRKSVALYKVNQGKHGHAADSGMGVGSGGGAAAEDDEEDDDDAPGAEDDEAVRLEELLTGLAVDDAEAAHSFRDDDDDLRFLAGQFVPDSDTVRAAEGSATSPDSKAAAEAFLAGAGSTGAASGGGFNLGTANSSGKANTKAGKKKK